MESIAVAVGVILTGVLVVWYGDIKYCRGYHDALDDVEKGATHED